MTTVETDVKVMFGHTDLMGIVFFTRFFEYFSIGMEEYLSAILPAAGAARLLKDRRVFFVIKEAHCEYMEPARFRDILRVHASVGDIHGSSVKFVFGIYRKADGKMLAKGHLLTVPLDEEWRRVPISGELAAVIKGEGKLKGSSRS